MTRQSYRLILITTLLLASGLACSLFSRAASGPQGLKATGQALASQVNEGGALVSTMQAAITENAPGLLATAEAVVTSQGSELAGTVEAFATEEGPGLKDTAEAMITEGAPGVLATGQAVMTQVYGSQGDVPSDIPLLEESQRDNFTVVMGMVTYDTPLPFQQVLDFYLKEMAARGWTQDKGTSLQTDQVALLNFTKGSRTANVTLGVADDKVSVLIVASPENQ